MKSHLAALVLALSSCNTPAPCKPGAERIEFDSVCLERICEELCQLGVDNARCLKWEERPLKLRCSARSEWIAAD